MEKTIFNLTTGVSSTVNLSAEEVMQMSIDSAAAVQTYAQLRARAYPSIADQLDLLYHGGYDAWKAAITAVKEEFPK